MLFVTHLPLSVYIGDLSLVGGGNSELESIVILRFIPKNGRAHFQEGHFRAFVGEKAIDLSIEEAALELLHLLTLAGNAVPHLLTLHEYICVFAPTLMI